jgi:hypothetical protein
LHNRHFLQAHKLERALQVTGWKFVCSKCYDKVYNNNMLLQSLDLS